LKLLAHEGARHEMAIDDPKRFSFLAVEFVAVQLAPHTDQRR
jgi:hypothetical protein